MNRELLLEQLTALDFMAVDLGLYLDTHPEDKTAIAQYNSVISNAEGVRAKFEKLHGPLCSYRSGSSMERWGWIDCPWPWECDANYQLPKCEK